MSLKFDEKKGNDIPNVFGMSTKDYDKLEKEMVLFMGKNMIEHKKLEGSYTDLLKEFLESKEFAKLKLDLKDSNTMFLLGYTFGRARRLVSQALKKALISHLLEKHI